MRCPLCGTEFFGNDRTCPGCGNYLRDDSIPDGAGAPSGNFVPQRQTPMQPYPQGINTPIYQQPNYLRITPRLASANRKRVVIVAVVMLVIVAFVTVFFSMFGNKKYDLDYFAIKLPYGMKKDSGSLFVSTILGTGQSGYEKAGELESRSVRFAYAVSYEVPKEGGVMKLSEYPEYIISNMVNTYSAQSSYKEFERTSDTLKFNIMGSNNELAYCHIRAVAENNRVYVLILVCNANSRNNYKNRFDIYMSSFKAK
ncbi:MAG: hypothetical protein IKP47_09340 [Ruminococcus sp.]|nr:hypothetical protein [Ruminococcus sp.]